MNPLTSLVALLTLGLAAAAPPAVLYDVRLPDSLPVISPAEQQVLRGLASNALRAGAWETSSGGASRDACASQQGFTVLGTARGAFTQKDMAQRAVLYNLCFIVPNQSNQGLVVLQGSKVIAHFTFTAHFQTVFGIRDFNRDGVSELGMVYTESGQGTEFRYLGIVDLRVPAQFLLFEQVTYNDCGNRGEQGWRGQTIRVAPRPRPVLTQQRVSGQCQGVEPFKGAVRVGAVQPLALKAQATKFRPTPFR